VFWGGIGKLSLLSIYKTVQEISTTRSFSFNYEEGQNGFVFISFLMGFLCVLNNLNGNYSWKAYTTWINKETEKSFVEFRLTEFITQQYFL
jgi:hypothetical protein